MGASLHASGFHPGLNGWLVGFYVQSGFLAGVLRDLP